MSTEELLRPLDPDEERELGEALRAAWAPGDLDPALNEALIELALEDPLAEATPDEIAESQRLREALEGGPDGAEAHPDAALARALKAAALPEAMVPGKSEALVDASLARRRNVIYVAFGTVSAVAALAAGVLLFLQTAPQNAPTQAAPASVAALRAPEPLALSRSTQELFQEKFERGKTSDRIDRIARARSRDLRRNRYARWGAR